MSKIFRFKQFDVDQTGCAMKINTDGVLLGAMAEADNPVSILDIGTGTGVIALMLAQRFAHANVDAVEIDQSAAKTAGQNFKNSIFHDRLKIYPSSIGTFFNEHIANKYDLIVSNPPFYINSLESPTEKRSLAKHTETDFFDTLMRDISWHLSEKGLCWLILPLNTSAVVKDLANQNDLCLQKVIDVNSYHDSEPHRLILCLGFDEVPTEISKLTIYKNVGVYADEYKELLKPYFLAF